MEIKRGAGMVREIPGTKLISLEDAPRNDMPSPEREERWALAVEVARGRMPGGWVPVDADLLLALHARLDNLVSLERQIADGEELDKCRRDDGRREWSSTGTWLYPGDRVVVLRV